MAGSQKLKPYLLVTGDLMSTGGMDMANLALARYLADRGNEVHLVAHRVAKDLAARPNVFFHKVPKPGNSYLLGAPILARTGRQWASRISRRGGRVLVNGGNCNWGDANWVHYVHAAYRPQVQGRFAGFRSRWSRRTFLRQERSVLAKARVIVANSERTRRDLIERLGVPADRVHTVYYGVDRERFRPSTPEERAGAAARLSWPATRPFVAFVGALGDRRKGFDTVFSAWQALCADPAWDANLAVIGTGKELPHWRARAARSKLESRISFLGSRSDIPAVLAACGALVSPTRYEPFGLGVQEALCCGLPAFVSRSAGVAERYPAELQHLLIPDPEDVGDLVEHLRAWRARPAEYRNAVIAAGDKLRGYTWENMAARMIALIEAAG